MSNNTPNHQIAENVSEATINNWTTATIHHSLSSQNQSFLDNSLLRLSKKARDPLAPNSKTRLWSHAFFDLYADQPLRKRQALSFAYSLRNAPIHIFDGNLVGHLYNSSGGYWYPRHPDINDTHINAQHFDPFLSSIKRIFQELPESFHDDGVASVEEVIKTGGRYWFPVQCAPGHIGWRWDWIVNSGFNGLLERINRSIPNTDEKGVEELECMRICVEAAIDWCETHVTALNSLLQDAIDDDARLLLRKKIDICKHVPRHGARNFHEAVQAFLFAYELGLYECHYGGNSPGRLDFHLWPYLEKDLSTGTQTLKTACDLIDELFILFNERFGHGEETIVVGGCDRSGKCAANPLTKIIVESIILLRGFLRPSVYIRISPNSPEWLYDLSAAHIANGGNRGQILNDESIVKAITTDGSVQVEDARDYMCGGCMEISPFGMNGDLLFTGFFNVGKVFELVLAGGICLISGDTISPHLCHSTANSKTFKAFYQTFLGELKRRLNLSFKRMDIQAEELAKFRPVFLLSSMIADCIENARVINDGGARYEDFGSTPLGLPNVADSLIAIKKIVFEEKSASIADIVEALKVNFVGHENLRSKLLALPKYGQGNIEADSMMSQLVKDVCDIYGSYENRHGGKVKPMIMTFAMAPIIGETLGASPDGRLAKQPIAHGITPQNIAMKHGISTVINSTTSVPLSLFSGGASHMLDLDKSLSDPQIIKSLLKVFFRKGGQMFQGNVTGVEELKNARLTPSAYPDLTVRVGGFSAYFTQLDACAQYEIISRHHHSH